MWALSVSAEEAQNGYKLVLGGRGLGKIIVASALF